MSNRIGGLQGYVMIGTAPATGSAVTTTDEFLGAKSFTLSAAAEAPDVTGFDSGDWRETVPGLKGFTGSVEASWDEGMELLSMGEPGTPPVIMIGNSISVRLVMSQPTTGTVIALEFNAVVSNVSWNVTVGGAVEYNIQFTGEGTVNFTTVKTPKTKNR